MHCTGCGKENPDNAQFCGSCGKAMPQPSAAAEAKTCGLAIASLVLGILGFVSGLSAIPGLILGIMALSRINRSAGRLRGKGLATAGIITSSVALVMLFVIAVLAAMLMPAVAGARLAERRSNSRANLHQIGLGIAMYSAGNRDQYPPDLGALIEQQYLGSRDVLLDPNDAEAQQLGPDAAPPSYEYVGPIPITRVPAGTIICYSRKGIYRGGRNVLYADCAVGWVDEQSLKEAGGDPRHSLRASYEAVVEAFGQELTPERDAELRKFYEVED